MGRADLALGVPVSANPYPSPVAGGLTIVEAPIGASVVASATPHAKGAWTELIAATSSDTDWFTFHVTGQMSVNGVDSRGLLDIGIGAAAAEMAIITEIPAGFLGNGMTITLPVRIPKASRVSARLQALIVSDTITIHPALMSTNMPTPSPTKLVTLNADTAASTSTTMMTSSDTWAEVTASTAQPFQGLVAVPCGGASDAWTNDTNQVLSVGVGASGAEILAASTFPINWSSAEQIGNSITYGYPAPVMAQSSTPVSAGTRVATKITTGRAYKGAIVFGVPY